MKKILITVALSILSISAYASDWQKVGEAEKSFYFMEFDSIAQSNQYVKAWVRINYLESQDTVTYPKKKYRSSKVLYYFDCKGRMMSSIQSIHYDQINGAGDVVNSSTIKFNPQDLSDIAPDTVGESMLKAACAHPAERAKIKVRNKAEIDALINALSKPQQQASGEQSESSTGTN